MTDYIIKLSTEQLSGSITYVNSPDPPSSPTLEVEDFWRIRLKKVIKWHFDYEEYAEEQLMDRYYDTEYGCIYI